MDTLSINNGAVLTLVLRVILGILFFFQGFDKVFNVKTRGVADYFRLELGSIRIPGFILTLAALFTSYAEMVCGALLIIGLFKTYALYVLGVDLMLVAAAFSLIKPMWDLQQLFPRLILLGVLLYLPATWDVISTDHLVQYLRSR